MKPQFTIFALNPANFIRFGFFNQTLTAAHTSWSCLLALWRSESAIVKWVLRLFLQTLDFYAGWWRFPCDSLFWWRERDSWLLNMYISNEHVHLPSLILVVFCRRWNILTCLSFSDCDLKPKDGRILHFPRAFSSRVGWPSSENFLQVLETSCINVL